MSIQIEREYRTVDKSAWGDGPWSDEPDKVQWTDPATGFPCLAVRAELGAWCGYVGVPQSHRLYGARYCYDTPALEGACTCGQPFCHPRPEHLIDIHGGLTFSSYCSHGPEESSVCHVPRPGETDDVWWFGWDCCHYGDLLPGFRESIIPVIVPELTFNLGYQGTYRGLAYVQGECAGLARQLAQLG